MSPVKRPERAETETPSTTSAVAPSHETGHYIPTEEADRRMPDPPASGGVRQPTDRGLLHHHPQRQPVGEQPSQDPAPTCVMCGPTGEAVPRGTGRQLVGYDDPEVRAEQLLMQSRVVRGVSSFKPHHTPIFTP
jgi:hypothetical protein